MIAPFVNYEVQGLYTYAGRPQVAARTGGASATQEVGAIAATYTLGANNTVVAYDIDPLPATGGNGVYPPDVIEEGMITLSESGINSIVSAVAWDEAYSGGFDKAVFEFPIRIGPVGGQGNDNADGMGFAYLNSEFHGTTGVSGPGTSEEPNFNASLGVGFDIWDNGSEGGNSISLHYGSFLASRIIDAGTNDPNTGQPWAFNSLETDEIINATIEVTPGAEQVNFPELINGSPYTIRNTGGGMLPQLIQVGAGNSQEGYLRIVPESTGIQNVVAFDYDGSGANEKMQASFDFRGLTVDGSRADGMSFLLVPTSQYDETGADLITLGVSEEANLAGALGFSIDTWNTDADPQDDPEGHPNIGNHVSIHFDGTKLAQTNFDRATEWDAVTSDPSIWNHAQLNVDGDDVQIVITDGVDGSVHTAFSGTIPGLSAIGPVRPAFAARTGGSMDNYEIDNFKMWLGNVGIPGDYNNNQQLDAGDLDLQAAAMVAGGPKDPYDLNGDNAVDFADREMWLHDLKKTWVGDANLDLVFDSNDFVQVFVAGKYETGAAAGWEAGDWDGNQVFDSGDFVAAFVDGGYEIGQRPAAVSAVPEPSSLVLVLLGLVSLLGVARRR